MRSAASWSHPWQDRAVPRGARIGAAGRSTGIALIGSSVSAARSSSKRPERDLDRGDHRAVADEVPAGGEIDVYRTILLEARDAPSHRGQRGTRAPSRLERP